MFLRGGINRGKTRKMHFSESLTFTVDELINHLSLLKEEGILSGEEEVIDVGFFGLTHVNVEKSIDGNLFAMLKSQEFDDAQYDERKSFHESIF